MPWAALLALIAPHAPVAKTGRPPFALETLLRIHFLQQWYGLSDVAMEEALFDVPLYREFAGLGGMRRIPDRVSLLRFRHLLEKHNLWRKPFWTPSTPTWRPGVIGCARARWWTPR